MTEPLTDISPPEATTTVHLLGEIERQSVISQESLATRLNVAVGLTNAYIKRCVRKGLIKVQRVPSRRFAYFLTPSGFAEKSRLTAEYLSHSFGFFRRAKSQSQELLRQCHQRGWNRIALYGASDLAEIAVLSAFEVPGVRLIGIVDETSDIGHFAGLPVVRRFEALGPYDAVFVSDMTNPRRAYDQLRNLCADEHILLAPLLHVVRPSEVARS